MTPPLCVGEWRERRCEGVRVAVVSAHLDLPQKWHFSAASRSTQAVDREDGRVCSKHNEDNKMQFMTANLIRGWFQRMEHVRKYAFGVALIIGEERRHDIVALWVFRGRGMPAIVEDVEDTELFDWEEVADVAAQRERITDYLCWEGPTIPRPVLEGRVFK
ncbi:putative elongation factor 1-gamma [Trypanosoma cruzi]|nr:putative elongation factor 1-gamma [Trypanosoma cruzi]